MNWKFEIGNLKLTHRAFTIVELVVAMGLLVMLVGLSSVVFSTTVKAHRKATATIEITRNLRVLTEQLNADFQGLRKDAPLMLWFDSRLSGTTETRFDMTHFFADGDFQTIREYSVRYDSDYDGVLESSDAVRPEIISGNLARIFYGHANSPAVVPDFKTGQVLSRKSQILTSHSGALFDFGEVPQITNATMYTPFDTSFGMLPSAGINSYENKLEFNTITLTNWINALNYLDAGNSNNADHFIAYCLTDGSRPVIDLADFQTLHLLMAQGVMDFSIQWAYMPDDLAGTVAGFTEGIRWWPSIDPDGDPATNDSDFAGMNGGNLFGVYFTLPGGSSYVDWFDVISANPIKRCKTDNGFGGDVYFKDGFYPTALKFTFRLKDSNNIFPEGKTFTHIVYLDN